MVSKEYPEHAKLDAYDEEHSAIVEFLEWLYQENLQICTVDSGNFSVRYYPYDEEYSRLAMRSLDIDPKVIEQERRAMLAALRNSTNS